ncbi:MAG: hypothetical protein KDK28_09560 [Maritimibacter sp.]|nr:hypothetical protein [Maritimibacter sp.]
MPVARYLLLLFLVILAGGATVWLGWAAASAGQLDGQVLMAMMPLVMVAALAWRALTGKRD